MMNTKEIERLKNKGILKELDFKEAWKRFEQGETIIVQLGKKAYNLVDVLPLIYHPEI